MSARGPRATSARLIAHAAIHQVLHDQAFSNRALAHLLERHPDLSARDRGLATTLTYGTLLHLARLDALLDACAHRPGKLPPRVRTILRVGAFELRELRAPPHAAISQAVAAVAELAGGRGLARAVGGILDRLAREGDPLDEALANGRPLDVLARRYSVPRWWAGRWLATLGPGRALARARALLEPAPLELCAARRLGSPAEAAERLTAERPQARVELLERPPGALRIHGGADVFYGPSHGQGRVWVQAAASQLPVHLLDPRPGETVLDLCAGQGIKTRQIADRMVGEGRVWAMDPSGPRLARLEALADDDLLGEIDLRTRTHDATSGLPAELVAACDAVLVDAPCTGLGEVARHPEIKWRRRFEDIAARAALQREILATAARALAPGGRLVYAVCSLEPEEGPQVVRAVAPAAGLALAHEETWTPEHEGSDGFYVARLRPA